MHLTYSLQDSPNFTLALASRLQQIKLRHTGSQQQQLAALGQMRLMQEHSTTLLSPVDTAFSGPECHGLQHPESLWANTVSNVGHQGDCNTGSTDPVVRGAHDSILSTACF